MKNTKRSKTKKVVSKAKKSVKRVKKVAPHHTPASRRKSVAAKALTVKLPLVIEVACDWDDVMISSVIHGIIGEHFAYHRCGDAVEQKNDYGMCFVEHAVVYAAGRKNDRNVQALVQKYAPNDEEKAPEETNVWEAIAELRRGMHAFEAAVGVSSQ
jgi:hypothetical protein